MNERIKELEKQCWNHQAWQLDAEKFADLIVRECGEIAYKTYWDNPETVRGIHIKEKIKEHFGVEK